ncbi:RNA polymerase sigma factor [Clostridium sp. Cult2]|uniref:RNA polymerase sigma factor n=1 Tax=Clostridium sp. Cult2 TaxID=2079003 RepID=UPI001F169797|nr:RNA polymerase sigma factor [Clostridium sp. Cult2]MCF6464420.1 RNA polymerase subunit sigma [Clostridium sp. Cult2]
MDFEEVYYLYFREVFLYIRSLSGDENIAEEVTQQTFFKALKAINSFDGSKDIRAWLFTIAKNTYFSYYKRNKRNIGYDSLDDTPDTGVTITEHLSNEEYAFIIHQFLHTMEEPYKEVFSLRVFGELPFEKIGKLFGKSSGWARVTYHRARMKVIEYMEGMNNERD